MANRHFWCKGIWRDSGKPAAVLIFEETEEAAIAVANGRGVMVESTEVAKSWMEANLPSIAWMMLPFTAPLSGTTIWLVICGAVSTIIGLGFILVACNLPTTRDGYYNMGLLDDRHIVFEFGFVSLLAGVLDFGFAAVVNAIRGR